MFRARFFRDALAFRPASSVSFCISQARVWLQLFWFLNRRKAAFQMIL
jgi:hypothetical protein